jgi:hypothetical protein
VSVLLLDITLLRKRRQAAALRMGLGVARVEMFACGSSPLLLTNTAGLIRAVTVSRDC